MQLIIFDIDGTLTDTTYIDHIAYKESFAAIHGVQLTEADWYESTHHTDLGIYEEQYEKYFGRKPTGEEMMSLQKEMLQRYTNSRLQDSSLFNEIPGAATIFESLKDLHDTGLAIATGCWSFSALFKLQSAGISFQDIPMGSSDGKITREEITQKAIELAKQKYGVKEFSKTIYVGDGVWDFRTCRNLGIPLIGIDVRGNGKLAALGHQMILRDYNQPEEFLSLLEKL